MLSSTSNNFMEKRKPRESIVDRLVLAKSAAWAWLEHRSGPDDRPMAQFNVFRTKFSPKPSRYKAEATRKVQETMRKVQQTSNSTRTINVRPIISGRGNSNYSLLDSYEIKRISRQLDYCIQSSHANRHSGGHGGGRSVAAAAGIKSEAGRKKKVPKGFWLLGPNAVVCGSSIDEVVDWTSVEHSRRRRRPEKGRVAVVEAAGCRPRQGIRA